MDKIILSTLNTAPAHGYKILADLHKNFGVLISPRTIYSFLNRLMEGNLVEIKEENRKKVYKLTHQGRKRAAQITELYKKNSARTLSFIEENFTSP